MYSFKQNTFVKSVKFCKGEHQTVPNKTERKKREAISLLLTGKTDAEVAEAVGVTRQTIWKWKREEDFNHDIVEAGEGILAEHTSAVAKLVDEAVVAVSELLKSDDESMKFKAAMTVLNSAKNWRELRPEAPGHTRAENEIDEEAVAAMMQVQRLQDQFQKEGGKPEDFTTWVLQGGFQTNGNGAEAANSNESENPQSANAAD